MRTAEFPQEKGAGPADAPAAAVDPSTFFGFGGWLLYIILVGVGVHDRACLRLRFDYLIPLLYSQLTKVNVISLRLPTC